MNDPYQLRTRKRSTYAVFLWIGGIGIVVCGLIVVVLGVRDSIAFSGSLSVLHSALQDVRDDISHVRYSHIQTDLKKASSSVDELNMQIQTSFIFNTPFSPLEKYREQSLFFLDQVRVMLSASEELSGVFIPMAEIALRQEGDLHMRQLNEEEKKKLLDILTKGTPSLVGAQATFELVENRLSSLSPNSIPGVAKNISIELQNNAKTLRNYLEQLIPALSIAPTLLGHNKETTYLLLFQNNAETRATGGFIGTYGTITLRNGEIVRFETDNVYNLDDQARHLSVPAPVPLQKYGNIHKWYLRDSNWSPDFTEAARQAVWFYGREGGKERIDGVIALTPEVIASLMRIVGDISVDGLSFSPDQLYDQLQYQVEKGYESRGVPRSGRKDVIKLIAEELLRRFCAMSIVEWSQISGVIRARLAEKTLLVYSTDEELQNALVSAGWSGEITQTEGDYLMVVDSNIISLKTDAVMDKHIAYSITEDNDGILRGRVELTYHNNGTYSWTSTTYRDYVRILIPQGSTILSERDSLEISQEYGKMVLGRILSVEPQKTTSLVIEYRLPQRIHDQLKKEVYTLFVQKQSGILKQDFSLNTSFHKPIKSLEPAVLVSSLAGGVLNLSSTLITDKYVSLRF